MPAAAGSVTFAEFGNGAGQVNAPTSIAVDQATGTVYVADRGNNRIDVFGSAGTFERAFGWGVLNGAAELQTCTVACQPGKEVSAPGGIGPIAIAVDPSSHDLYVVDNNHYRIEKFTSSGQFLLIFGKEVDKTKVAANAPVTEQDVCTNANLQAGDTCGSGTPGPTLLGNRGTAPGVVNAGYFNVNTTGGALDGTALSIDQAGHIWLGDSERLEQFSSEGAYLSEVKLPGFGIVTALAAAPAGDFYALSPPVNEEQEITPPASGTYTLSFEGQATAPIPFDAAGSEVTTALQGLSTIGQNIENETPFQATFQIGFRRALAHIDVPQIEISSGSVVTVAEGTPGGLAELGSSGEALQALDASGHPNALGLDPATGSLFVSDQGGGLGSASIFEYDSSGAQIESFGTGGVIGHPEGNALAFGDSAQRLYVVSSLGGSDSAAQAISLPEPGPLPEENGESAEPRKTTATLRANVNPEGRPTTVHFEYITKQKFEEDGNTFGAGTEKTPESASIGEDFSQHPASVQAIGLSPETAYRFRLVASNENGSVKGQGAAFTTLPPLRIDATYATEVSSTGATLAAQINPLGDPAGYHFEYLTEADYEANLAAGPDGFFGARVPTSTPISDGTVAVAETDLTVSRHVGGLVPSTAYRFRVVASNSIRPAGIAGSVKTFTTQGPGGTLALPDHRAWEMFSPVDKNGGGISGIDQGTYLIPVQAAANGEAIAYGSPVAFADPAGSPPGNQYLSGRHGSAGWSTENLGIPTNSETNGPATDPPFKAFSFDLAAGLLSAGSGITAGGPSKAPPNPPLPGTEAAEGFGNYYLREAAGPSYQAILTEAAAGSEASLPLFYEAATSDLRHVVFGEAGKSSENPNSKGNLYEWTDGHFELLNLLPGKTTPTNASEGLGNGERSLRGLRDPRALSADGSRAVWAAGTAGSEFSPAHNLYLREKIGQPQSAFGAKKECTEPEAACTVQIDASEGGAGKGGNGTFLAAAADDSAIFFADHQRLTPDSTADQLKAEVPQLGDLYRFAPDAEAGQRLTDLTVDHGDPKGAEVLGVLGASDNGSYLYFVANGVLTAEENAQHETASPGDCNADNGGPGKTCNLYLFHGGVTTFIATLAGEDNNLRSDVVSLGAGEGINTGSWVGVGYRDARVSPDGHNLLFTSYAALTGYDNTAAGGSSCGSDAFGIALQPACPEVFRYAAPTGSSPAGSLACLSCNPTGQRPLGLSGVPTGTHTSNNEVEGIYASRVLSADGRRAFFDSYDALVPQDTNGKLDVYEWEEAGAGTCEESSATFSGASGGCISLISSGTGSENSAFMDASADGSDTFFITGSSLVPADPGSVDLYDARENGGLPEPPPPPASCQGDACQSPPPAPNDPTPASSSYSGPGNEHSAKKKHPKKHRKHHKAKKHHKRAAKTNRGGAK